jgi:hypothetical protein
MSFVMKVTCLTGSPKTIRPNSLPSCFASAGSLALPKTFREFKESITERLQRCWRPRLEQRDVCVRRGILVGGRDMRTVKQDVESLLNRLPDDVSVEDIQYHLYVLDKVRRGLEDARVNGVLSQEEVESRFGKWLAE